MWKILKFKNKKYKYENHWLLNQCLIYKFNVQRLKLIAEANNKIPNGPKMCTNSLWQPYKNIIYILKIAIFTFQMG